MKYGVWVIALLWVMWVDGRAMAAPARPFGLMYQATQSQQGSLILSMADISVMWRPAASTAFYGGFGFGTFNNMQQISVNRYGASARFLNPLFDWPGVALRNFLGVGLTYMSFGGNAYCNPVLGTSDAPVLPWGEPRAPGSPFYLEGRTYGYVFTHKGEPT